MDFPTRIFLFLLSTLAAYVLLSLSLAAGSAIMLFPPLLGYTFTAFKSYTISQKKRMDALEKEVAELKEKIETLKPTEISEGK